MKWLEVKVKNPVGLWIGIILFDVINYYLFYFVHLTSGIPVKGNFEHLILNYQ